MDDHNYTLDVLKDYNREGYYPKYCAKFYPGKDLKGANKLPGIALPFSDCIVYQDDVLSGKELIAKGMRAGQRHNDWESCVAACKSINKFMEIGYIHEAFMSGRTHTRNNKNREEITIEKLTKQEQIELINSFFDEAQQKYPATLKKLED